MSSKVYLLHISYCTDNKPTVLTTRKLDMKENRQAMLGNWMEELYKGKALQDTILLAYFSYLSKQGCQ